MNIVTKLLSYQNQVKILHWQTTSYAEHKTLDGLYGDLSGHIDEFVEIFMGKYGRVLAQNSFNLVLENYKNMPPMSLMVDIANNVGCKKRFRSFEHKRRNTWISK